MCRSSRRWLVGREWHTQRDGVGVARFRPARTSSSGLSRGSTALPGRVQAFGRDTTRGSCIINGCGQILGTGPRRTAPLPSHASAEAYEARRASTMRRATPRLALPLPRRPGTRWHAQRDGVGVDRHPRQTSSLGSSRGSSTLPAGVSAMSPNTCQGSPRNAQQGLGLRGATSGIMQSARPGRRSRSPAQAARIFPPPCGAGLRVGVRCSAAEPSLGSISRHPTARGRQRPLR